MKTLLKIIIDKDFVYADDRHVYGGVDLFQRNRFCHLTGGRRAIDVWELEFLIDMAEAHGWEVVESEPPKKS